MSQTVKQKHLLGLPTASGFGAAAPVLGKVTSQGEAPSALMWVRVTPVCVFHKESWELALPVHPLRVDLQQTVCGSHPNSIPACLPGHGSAFGHYGDEKKSALFIQQGNMFSQHFLVYTHEADSPLSRSGSSGNQSLSQGLSVETGI